MKKSRNKRVIEILLVLVLSLSILSIQVIAAPSMRPSGYITGTMGPMIVTNGNSMRLPVSTGILPPNSTVTGFIVTITISGDPCYLYIQSPYGNITILGPYVPGTYTISIPGFIGSPAQGTWSFWLQSAGTSIVAMRVTINYFYP